MKTNIAAITAVGLIAACDATPEAPQTNDAIALDRVDICDLRPVFGTCVEYQLSELEAWYRDNIESTCRFNRRGEIYGEFRENARCPAENRIARCEGMIEDPAEQYEYDKHYYTGTSDPYTWEADSVKQTCDMISGRFIPE